MKFEADRASGISAYNFLVSTILPEGIKRCTKIGIVEYPFWGLTLNTNKNSSDEWIKKELYRKETQRFFKDMHDNGLDLLENTVEEMHSDSGVFKKETRDLENKLKTLSDQELLDKYNNYRQEYLDYWSKGVPTFLYESILSDRLADSIQDRYSIDVLDKILSTDYDSFILKSEKLLAKIEEAEATQRDELISKYLDNFYYMKSGYYGAPKITREDVLEEAKNLSFQENAEKRLKMSN